MMVYQKIVKSKDLGKKLFALLIDPDRLDATQTVVMAGMAAEYGVDLILVGSSLLTGDYLKRTISLLKAHTDLPVLLFPGSNMQLSPLADSLLLLSLISGRNADFLIGKHVESAGVIKQMGLEVIPTGYMLIDPGHPTSVSYMSGTNPIPHDKHDIAAATALAGEQLGKKLIYMDAGSGARNAISSMTVAAVRQVVKLPIVVGGGIKSPERAISLLQAGADVLVVGNAIEKDPGLIAAMSAAIHGFTIESR
ncbi:MAG: hypothetical protein RIQ89_2076 [Bacteroidota bacterium]|jgi:phosphoglycerol geranylgeranyltransferase